MSNLPFTAVACVQFPIIPGHIETNLQHMVSLVDAHRFEPGSLVVLPEMWATGFDYSRIREMAAATPELLKRLQEIAARSGVYFAGSLPEARSDDQHPRNTLFVTGGAGVVARWPKQFMFGAWKEDRFLQPGRSEAPVQVDGGRLGGFVCYDLRFPELAREQAFNGASLLAVCAQWPKVRLDHWQALLRARAIENQLYIVAANGCGVSGEIELAGHSLIIAPDGSVLVEAGEEASVISSSLDPGDLERVRRSFCPPGQRPWRGRDQEKIFSLAELQAKLAALRAQGSSIAFTNGCFDILHAGHVSYLERARQTADCLVVGLNSDSSVSRLKGPSRPVNREADRARVLAGLGCVDYVVLFAEDTPLQLITALLPDVLVKGADWAEDEIVGGAEVKAAGGRVERVVFEHDCSTTKVIDTIRNA